MKRPEEKDYYIPGSRTTSECVDNYRYKRDLTKYIDYLESKIKGIDKIQRYDHDHQAQSADKEKDGEWCLFNDVQNVLK